MTWETPWVGLDPKLDNIKKYIFGCNSISSIGPWLYVTCHTSLFNLSLPPFKYLFRYSNIFLDIQISSSFLFLVLWIMLVMCILPSITSIGFWSCYTSTIPARIFSSWNNRGEMVAAHVPMGRKHFSTCRHWAKVWSVDSSPLICIWKICIISQCNDEFDQGTGRGARQLEFSVRKVVLHQIQL